MATTDAINEPLSKWTTFTYDSWFRTKTETDPLGAITTRNYDVFGNTTSIVDPLNNTTSYTYNKVNQLVTENKGTNRSYSYDANGNLATFTDRNSRVTTYTYDNRNRLTNESWAGTRTIGYVYDSVDRLTAVNDSDPLALDFVFAYDKRSQLQGEIQSGSSYLLGKNFAFDRDFDLLGNQTKLASFIGGTLSGTEITGGIADFVNTYTFDNLGRQTVVSQAKAFTGNGVAPKRVTINPRKTPEPPDAAIVYGNSIRSGMGEWYGIGQDGQIYRFFSDNAGGVHFSGIVPLSQVPLDVRRQLGL